MVTQIWVNVGLGNGLLADGTKPLPEPMLTYNQRWAMRAISHEVFINLIHNMYSAITLLKLLPHVPVATELNIS